MAEPEHPPLDRYRCYSEHAHQNSQLMAQRLNTLLSSQSFLAIAYATSMGSANGRWEQPFAVLIPPVLSVLAIVLVLAGRLDIDAARREIGCWRAKAADLLREHPYLRATLEDNGVSDSVALRHSGELLATRAPAIFTLAWAWFLVVPICLYLTN